MKSPNNRRDGVPPGHLSSSDEASTTRNRLHLIKLLAEGDPWEHSNSLGYYQGYWLLPKNLVTRPYCEHICITH